METPDAEKKTTRSNESESVIVTGNQSFSRFDNWLRRVNHRFGGVGSVVTTLTFLAILCYALVVILEEYFGWM